MILFWDQENLLFYILQTFPDKDDSFDSLRPVLHVILKVLMASDRFFTVRTKSVEHFRPVLH